MLSSSTRLRLHNEAAGTRRTVRLPIPAPDAVSRLRELIDPPADEFDTVEADTAVYATARGKKITLVAYGCDRTAAHAELARVLSELRRALP